MDLVVGLDSSTTATKAVDWNREGRAVGSLRLPQNTGSGSSWRSADAPWTRCAGKLVIPLDAVKTRERNRR